MRFASVTASALLFILTSVARLEAQTPRPAAPPDDRAASSGRWDVVAVEINGKPVDPELVSMLHVVYQADGSWAVYFKKLAVAEGRSVNRQDVSPKAFEMEMLGSERMPPQRYTGIYRLDGDTRQLCFVPEGKPRPDAFEAPRRSGRILVTLGRTRER